MNFLFKLIGSHTGISSKRFCGILGWIICLITLVYCTINQLQAPEITNTIIYACMGLLGIDSITGIWKNIKVPS